MEATLEMRREVPARQKKKRGISGSTVKIVAVISMLIDHTAAVVLMRQIVQNGYINAILKGESALSAWIEENALLYYTYDIMRMIGRMGFPIFCFLLAEGFQRTGNVKKYALRLGIFALISEVPFDLAIKGVPFSSSYQNVYFTLFLGLFALFAYSIIEKCGQPGKRESFPWLLRKVFPITGALFSGVYFGVWLGIWFIPGNGGEIQDYLTMQRDFPVSFILLCAVLCAAAAALLIVYRKKKGIERLEIIGADITVLILVMYLADLLRTDYGGMGVFTITVMYLLRKNRIMAMGAGCTALTIMQSNEFCAFLALIPVALYNGQRGLKMKYFFYAFYPVHLLLLYLLSLWFGLGSVTMF